MRRAHRWWLAALGALLALPLLALVLLLWWGDPDALRPTIERQLRTRLGIAVQLTGPLQWKLWPALSMQSGPGAIGIVPGAPVLRWQQLQFTMRWPGLHPTAWQFDGLLIDGLQMSLQSDAAGRWNVSALIDAMAARQAGGSQSAQALRIHPLRLRDADIQLALSPDSPPWRLTQLDLQVDLDSNAKRDQWTLEKLRLSAVLGGGVLPAGEAVTVDTARVQIELPAAGAADRVGGGSVRHEPVAMRLGTATLRVSATQPMQWQPLQGEGELQFDTPALRGWLAAKGVPSPPTRDASVLSAASLSAHWKVADVQAELAALQLRLDDTRLQGHAAGSWQAPQHWQVELQGDSLNLDRYRRPASDPGEPFRLPVDALRALPLNGSVRMQRLIAGGVVARDAVIELRSGDAQGGAGQGGARP